jgi:hypothetical protein
VRGRVQWRTGGSENIAYSTSAGLLAVDLATGRSSILAPNAWQVDDIEWSPDGVRL